jgi:hypothetical protein
MLVLIAARVANDPDKVRPTMTTAETRNAARGVRNCEWTTPNTRGLLAANASLGRAESTLRRVAFSDDY